MYRLLKYSFKASVLALLMLSFSCATYHQGIREYYTDLENQDYKAAFRKIDHNRLLNKKRNELLLLLEKGKVAHMMGDYETSNRYFNEADYFFEDVKTSASDVIMGTIMNPMMQTYRGEPFEKFMLHYYKALNYLFLGKPQEAIVEARRIELSNYSQADRSSKYSNDALGLILQGIIYEYAGDINNSFIAYRNAADLFLKNDSRYYGVELPLQLKKDLLRTAYLNGFQTEYQYYQQRFNMEYNKEEDPAGGCLVLFWENGKIPVKVEEDLFFSMISDASGNYFFTDSRGLYRIPFDHHYTRSDLKLSDLRMIRVAFPRYEDQPHRYRNGIIEKDSLVFEFEKAEDMNTLARKTLQERFLKEAGKALSRLAVKKITEELVRPKDDDTSSNKALKEALFIGLQLFNAASEKADTRHWQSLPEVISYSRIPLQTGTNTVSVKLDGNLVRQFSVEGNGRLQVRNFSTF